MTILNGNDIIIVCGIITMKDYKKRIKNDFRIDTKLMCVKDIGEYLYRRYIKLANKFQNVKFEVKTTKVIFNGVEISDKCKFKIHGYVKNKYTSDKTKYNFHTEAIFFDELIETLLDIFDDYILDFNTDENGLRFIIKNIEILD